MDMDLGTRISELRREKGMTQEQLAKLVGISAPAVSKWETGSSCPDIALLCPLQGLWTPMWIRCSNLRKNCLRKDWMNISMRFWRKPGQGTGKKRRQCCRNSFIRTPPAAPLNTTPLRYLISFS